MVISPLLETFQLAMAGRSQLASCPGLLAGQLYTTGSVLMLTHCGHARLCAVPQAGWAHSQFCLEGPSPCYTP